MGVVAATERAIERILLAHKFAALPDVDARPSGITRSHADTRLRRDARGRPGSVCQELAAGMSVLAPARSGATWAKAQVSERKAGCVATVQAPQGCRRPRGAAPRPSFALN